jgi:hypothetical protein
MDHGSAVYILRFTRVVRSQSTLQRLLRRQILKNTISLRLERFVYLHLTTLEDYINLFFLKHNFDSR